MSALSDLLNRYLDREEFRDLSNRQIADAARVSRGTIDNYRKGIHPAAPSEEILQAFHDLLGISLAELREAAGVPRGEPEPYVAPAEFNRLSHSQRTALDEFVRSFVGPQGVSNAVPTDPSASPRAPRKARKKQEDPPGDRPGVVKPIRPAHWDQSPPPPTTARAASKGYKRSDDELDVSEPPETHADDDEPR